MPPQIKPKFCQLKFRYFRGEKLPKMDISLLGGSIDAFIKVEYMKQKKKTKTVTMKDEIVDWNQEILIP